MASKSSLPLAISEMSPLQKLTRNTDSGSGLVLPADSPAKSEELPPDRLKYTDCDCFARISSSNAQMAPHFGGTTVPRLGYGVGA